MTLQQEQCITELSGFRNLSIKNCLSSRILLYINITIPSSTTVCRKKRKVKAWSRLAHSCRSLSRFLFHELGVFLLPLDGMLVHRRSLPHNLLGFPTMLWYPFILLGGERHCESWVFCPRTQHSPRPGLEPGPLAPGTSALAIRPPCLPHTIVCTNSLMCKV